VHRVVVGLNEIIHMKCFEQYREHSEHSINARTLSVIFHGIWNSAIKVICLVIKAGNSALLLVLLYSHSQVQKSTCAPVLFCFEWDPHLGNPITHLVLIVYPILYHKLHASSFLLQELTKIQANGWSSSRYEVNYSTNISWLTNQPASTDPLEADLDWWPMCTILHALSICTQWLFFTVHSWVLQLTSMNR
jgi:hypothetical protein